MRLLRILILCVIGWYVLLASVHYFNQRPLWNDEACVFASIKEYSTPQLFSQPLRHMQQFPRVHVWLIQQLSKPFDFNLLALRFFSLVAMLTAFALWLLVAYRQWGRQLEFVLTFALCWAASMPLVYYATELKPYSMDVLVGIVFLWVVQGQKEWGASPSLAKYWAPLALLPLVDVV